MATQGLFDSNSASPVDRWGRIGKQSIPTYNEDEKEPTLADHIFVDIELAKLLGNHATYDVTGTEKHEFDFSMLNQVPIDAAEDYYEAALLSHDMRQGVKHYPCRDELQPMQISYAFATYQPPTDTEMALYGKPLSAKQSYPCKVFERYPDGLLIEPPPNPWDLPIADAPETLDPSALMLPKRRAPSIPTARPTASFTNATMPPPPRLPLLRRTVPLPVRAEGSHAAPPPLVPPAGKQSSDYSAVTVKGKRKAVRPPAPRPEKKSAPGASADCSMDVDPPTNSQLPRDENRAPTSVHDECVIPCRGCTERFKVVGDLRSHLWSSQKCTWAEELCNFFFSLPTIVKARSGGLEEKHLITIWNKFILRHVPDM
ncbi:hypothetical protein B0H10DRAFT_2031284 [Mycena sp. CBHHK59/15]|nr:hypothetical protein B0H10DRAFT_2031284 [Mycena sp. CBHHK59/15]